ncbi:MAG: C39 family peptidase, partial [Vicinamibacterales bacterium]
CSAAAARAEAGAQPDRHALLDVPYLAQTPDLCGGAAVSMVLRYWGAHDVFPQDFVPLVREGGILTGALTAAVVDRGWLASVLEPVEAAVTIQREVDQGRPIITLIEVSPGTYHYVVVVAVTDDAVVVHDPARAPFRVLPLAEFDTVWAAAGRWMLRVLPRDGLSPGAPVPAPSPSPDAVRPAMPMLESPCQALVARSVGEALAGDATGAGRGLVAAIGLCPADSAARRELAGLRFSQRRWPEAEVLAREAVDLAPDDRYAWRLLATARYLTGKTTGALTAWNRADEPRIDVVDVHGAVRTSHPTVVRALDLEPRSLLTPAAYAQGLRRLRALPGVSAAQLRYQPLDGGRARLDAFIDERPTLPRGWLPLGVTGARALLLREVMVDVPGGLGAGERAALLWRWASRRPRIAFDLSLPAPHGLPGILSLEGAWERQTYADLMPSSGASRTEERRRVALRLSDWATHWLRWQAGAGVDGWRGRDPGVDGADPQRGRFITVEGGVDVRPAGDRLAVGASAAWWGPVAGQRPFETGTLRAAWRSSVEPARPSWSIVTALSGASARAPLAVWPGAGTGQARDGLLRAHPLLRQGVLTGAVFGRIVPRGTLTYIRPVRTGLSVAAFADMARAWHRPVASGASRLLLDVGAGLRVHAPGGGAMRIDLARGLRGGGLVVSAGWDEAWPQ